MSEMFMIGGMYVSKAGITDRESMWAEALGWKNRTDGLRQSYRELAEHLRANDRQAIRELRQYYMQPVVVPEYANHAILKFNHLSGQLTFLEHAEQVFDELDDLYARIILEPQVEAVSKSGKKGDFTTK